MLVVTGWSCGVYCGVCCGVCCGVSVNVGVGVGVGNYELKNIIPMYSTNIQSMFGLVPKRCR